MKIAIPTNDRETITPRTGRCKEFAVVEIEGDEVRYSYVPNHHEHHDGEEEHEHSHMDQVEAIKDVDVLMVKNVGKHLKKDLEAMQIPFRKTHFETIADIVNEVK